MGLTLIHHPDKYVVDWLLDKVKDYGQKSGEFGTHVIICLKIECNSNELLRDDFFFNLNI